MNIIACLFAIIGAALNLFQPVISTPASGSVFTGSMYDAFVVLANHISKNGLPGGDGAVGALLIFLVLGLVPVAATIQGLCVLFRKCSHVRINLFLCAIVDGLAATGIYYISTESFSSAFFADYIIPYAQRISFITPAIWALCYFIASVFAMPIKRELEPVISGDKPVVLDKNQKVDLIKKVTPGISKLYFGLGWTVNKKGEAPFDLDASAFMITANDKVANDLDFIFYHNLQHSSGAIEHSPDDYEGGNGSDDNEWITVDLNRLPSAINKIVFTVTIYEADKRNQNFGQVPSAFVRVADYDNEKKAVKMERLRYNLREKFSTETAVIIAELSRHLGGWTFTAIGEGVNGGLEAVCQKFGVNI